MVDHGSKSIISREVLFFGAGIVVGSAIGATLGILLAPHSGEITRRKLRRSAAEMRDQVRETLDELEESGRDMTSSARRTASNSTRTIKKGIRRTEN